MDQRRSYPFTSDNRLVSIVRTDTATTCRCASGVHPASLRCTRHGTGAGQARDAEKLVKMGLYSRVWEG
jgi:hypothetical protein